MAILIQQDVAGLEVQVQDVGSMQLCQPLQNLQGNACQLMQAQGTCNWPALVDDQNITVKAKGGHEAQTNEQLHSCLSACCNGFPSVNLSLTFVPWAR